MILETLAVENEQLRDMLRRSLGLAASGKWRDKAGLSLIAHPLFDEITGFLAGDAPTNQFNRNDRAF